MCRRCGLDPVCLWLWCRLAAVAPIEALAWEPPYAVGGALKRDKDTECCPPVQRWTSSAQSLLSCHVAAAAQRQMPWAWRFGGPYSAQPNRSCPGTIGRGLFPHARSSQGHCTDGGTSRCPLCSVMRPLWPPLQIPPHSFPGEDPFSGEAVGSGLHPWSFSREHSPNLPDGCFFLRHPRRGEGAHGGDKSISLLDSWGPPLGALQSSGVFVPEKQGSLCLLASPSDAKSSHTSRSGL